MLCNDGGVSESDSYTLCSMPCENTTCVRVCIVHLLFQEAMNASSSRAIKVFFCFGVGGGNAECGSLNTSSNASKCIAFCSRPLCMAKEGKGESEIPDQVALSNDAFRVLCLSVSVTWTSQIPASCCACCR